MTRSPSTTGSPAVGLLLALAILLACDAGSSRGALSEPPVPAIAVVPPGEAAAPPPDADSPVEDPVADLPELAPLPASAVDVVGFQTGRSAESGPIRDAAGRTGAAILTDLRPAVGRWRVLELRWDDGATRSLHLEIPEGRGLRLRLDRSVPFGLLLADAKGETRCDLWSDPARLEVGDRPWTPVCGDRILVRRTPRGRRTTLEAATELLRARVVGGEQITNLARRTLFRDAQREAGVGADGEEGIDDGPSGPLPATVDPPRLLEIGELGLTVATRSPDRIQAGRWREVVGVPGVWASALLPGLARPDVEPGVLDPLDSVEAEARVHLVAFDLSRFRLSYELGTDHPAVGWSPRAPAVVRDPALPGPDGFADLAPLQRPGSAPPDLVPRVVSAFTAGFKRDHGAFKHGALSQRNRGSHYGFVAQGVVLSRLQPGLATLLVELGGRVDLRVWTPEDDAHRGRVLHARQNGVPLVSRGPDGRARPGERLRFWAEGNWSGSIDGKLRSVRAGICLQERDAGERYLVYAYFSTATPSAMARVFLAYGCRSAMLLDMNALEHTYLSILHRVEDRVVVEHLVRGMEAVDVPVGGALLPRFLAAPDNRDFFLLTRREEEALP